MGGGYALQLAIAEPASEGRRHQLRRAGHRQGSPWAKIHAAVLGNFGGQDKGIPPDAVHAFEGAMQSLGKPVDAKIYPDAGHAFENPNNKTGYRPDDAADALGARRPFFRGRNWKSSG